MLEGARKVQTELTESARKVWLAGLGAFALAQEEGSKVFENLVERGREFEGSSPLDWARDRVAGTLNQLEGAVDGGMGVAMHSLGMPSREEIALLSKRVEELNASLEALRARALAKAADKPEKPVKTRTTPSHEHKKHA